MHCSLCVHKTCIFLHFYQDIVRSFSNICSFKKFLCRNNIQKSCIFQLKLNHFHLKASLFKLDTNDKHKEIKLRTIQFDLRKNN